jgi:tetratricopeptide (TPR) repeat protein
MVARSLGVLVALVLAHSSAWGGRASDDKKCADTPNAEDAIAACARLYENEGLGARNRAIALGNRAAALKVLGRYDEAIEDLTLAIELDPRSPQYRCQRGDLRVRKKEFAEAIADYSEALKRAPDYAWAYHGRGQAYLAQGNGEGAVADFDKALRAKPGELNLLVLRGRSHLLQNSYEAAAADFAKALASPKLKQRWPKERATVLSLRAFSLLKQGKAKEASPDAEEAVKLAPKNTFSLSVLGLVDEQLGRRAEAKGSFARALAVEPKLEVAQKGLDRLSQAATETGTLADSEEQPKPSDIAPSNAAEELCARYIATVGQTVLVACER